MKTTQSGTAITFAVLTVITLLHVGYRVTAPQGTPLMVSTFPLGSTPSQFTQFALASERPAAPLSSAAQCRIVVVFSPACPHCHSAAETEAATPQDDRLPTTWMTTRSDSFAVRFGARLHPDVQARYAPDVMTRLRVQAVPAAFLIDAGNVVRRIWVYQGDENHAELREQCG